MLSISEYIDNKLTVLDEPQGVLHHQWKQTPVRETKKNSWINMKIPPKHYYEHSTLIMEAAAWNAAEAIITAGQKKLASERTGPPLAPLHSSREEDDNEKLKN